MADDEAGIWIDGVKYTIDDLTFEEHHSMNTLIRQHRATIDPEWDGFAQDIDIIPAIITVVKKRDNPDFSHAEALKAKLADVVAPPTRKPRTSRGSSAG